MATNRVFKLWVAALLLCLGAGCAWMNLAADYDPVLDSQTSTLHQDTETFFTQIQDAIGTPGFDFSRHQDFYSSAAGRTKALLTRADLQEEGLKNTPLTDNYQSLLKQYQELQGAHQRQSAKITSLQDAGGGIKLEKYEQSLKLYWDSSLKAFQQSFRSIIEHLMVLKGILEERTSSS